MRKLLFSLCLLLTTNTAMVAQSNHERAVALLPHVFKMDTHSHVDVPMTADKWPGDRVNLVGAMKKADMDGIGMTFAVDYITLKNKGQAFDRFLKAVSAQDSILHWNGISLTLNGKELKKNIKKNKPVVIQSVEGGHFLEGNVSRLKMAYDKGLRVFCLLHDNDANPPLGDVYTNEPRYGGLTQLGADAIKECERLGILVDLAHCDSTTIAMALQVAKKPVIITHTGLNTRLGKNEFMNEMMYKRLISPAQAKIVASHGGVIGVWPHLADTPEEYASNIKAMIDIVGVDHVTIGTDTKITPEMLEIDAEMIERFKKEQAQKGGDDKDPKKKFPQKDPNAANHVFSQSPYPFYLSVIEALLDVGLSDADVKEVCGENFIRVFSEATK